MGTFFQFSPNFLRLFTKNSQFPSIGRQRKRLFYAVVSFCLQIICNFIFTPSYKVLGTFFEFHKKILQKIQEIFIPSLIEMGTFFDFHKKSWKNIYPFTYILSDFFWIWAKNFCKFLKVNSSALAIRRYLRVKNPSKTRKKRGKPRFSASYFMG